MAAYAQTELPSPVGATRMIEPLGYQPKPQPPLMPGPVTPQMAPVGPPDCLSLPASHTSAFQCEQYTPEAAWYFHGGAVAYQRYGLPRLQTAFREPGPPLDVPTVPAPPSVNVPVLNLHDLHPNMNVGPTFTLGYLEECQAWEISTFYLSNNMRSKTITDPGLLLVPFNTPAQGVPLGFEGDNGLWLNADRVREFYRNQMISAEFNYRRWSAFLNNIELILGVRYFNLQERAGIFTDDDLFNVNILGQSDPTRAATYQVTAQNDMVLAQFGGEWSIPCEIPYLGWLWFTTMGKGAVGANFIDRTFELFRGDKLRGFRRQVRDVNFGQLYEAGAYIDIHILERFRIRAGYQALFLAGVSDASYQINYNLLNPTSRSVGYRTEFYHGPLLELQFLF
jgi:hypothetical protein